jgi:hypothetical protein
VKAWRDRKHGDGGWEAWRAFVGIAYLAAACFNSVYTLPRHDTVIDVYGEDAWFPILGDFISDVFVPNGELFMVLVVSFEVAVAVLILSRDKFVDVGVVASLGWLLVVLPFLAFPYLLFNVALFIMQGVILLRRYDVATWTLARHALGRRHTPHSA